MNLTNRGNSHFTWNANLSFTRAVLAAHPNLRRKKHHYSHRTGSVHLSCHVTGTVLYYALQCTAERYNTLHYGPAMSNVQPRLQMLILTSQEQEA